MKPHHLGAGRGYPALKRLHQALNFEVPIQTNFVLSTIHLKEWTRRSKRKLKLVGTGPEELLLSLQEITGSDPIQGVNTGSREQTGCLFSVKQPSTIKNFP